ncbi:MAG: glutathione peroxidase [Gammaproteobacteria bacterium]|nr:glutathione peroxidase [Gammaproteobacteria bacterium]
MNLKKNILQAVVVVIGMTILKAKATCAPLLDHSARQLAGSQTDRLCKVYQGQVVMIVNTASKCGFTPQFDGLEALYGKYKDRGFTVLGFPSKDFGNQEYGSEQQTADFCRLTYGVQFPMYATTNAKKGKADPLFKGLAEAADGDYPSWNFHKYILDRNGNLIGSFGPFTGPSRLTRVIEDAL